MDSRSRGHRPTPSTSHKSQTASAYAALATELTRKDIRSIGGYSLGRVIGQGAWGKVRLGVHRLTGTRVAIKQVPKTVSAASGLDSSSPLSLLVREIHHHRRLRHPHILALYEIIATESSIYLVTELCTGGELFDYLVEKGRLSTYETRRLFGQLVLGVAHLHESGVVHRDLKLENVLLDERVNVKIADLGFGREFEKGRWMETWVGTLGYCAPEVVAAKRYLGEEVDIWSLGVILYTLLTGSLPFDDDDETVMKELIIKCEYDIPTWLDEDAADLIKSILVLDPLRRPSLRSVLSHAFFTRTPESVLSSPPPNQPARSQRASSPHLRRNDSQTHPPVIVEEGSSPVVDEDAPGQGLHASGVGVADSDSSCFSSEPGLGRSQSSGATTPITSEDDSHDAAVSSQKPTAEDYTEHQQRLKLLQRNESQATLRHGSPDLTPQPRPKSIALDENRPGFPFGLAAPSLQRNLSTSSSVVSISSLTGSPVPAHSRTPLRTKRRSFGSTFSERIFSLDEDAINHGLGEPHIDYLALLSTVREAPLASPAAQALLDDLTALGFDAGQIRHSITTDACDAPAAMFWMLAKKKQDGAAAAGGTRSGEVSRKSSLRRATSTGSGSASVSASQKQRAASIEEEREPVPRVLPPPIITATAAPPETTPGMVSPTSEERLDYFLQQRPLASNSAPLLDYFPTVEAGPGSPSRHKMPRSPSSREDIAANYSPRRASVPLSPKSSPSRGFPPSPVGQPSSPDSPRRNRAGSVSMLARATSVLGNSLALKKAPGEDGVVVRSSLFGRKSSLPDESLLATATSPTPSPSASPKKDRQQLEIGNAPVKDTGTSVGSTGGTSMSHSASHETFDTVTTSSSARKVSGGGGGGGLKPPGKKGSKGLFSNFKMWFVDDRRKRSNSIGKRPPSHSHSTLGHSTQSQGSAHDPFGPSRSISRSMSLQHRPLTSNSSQVASPLRKPTLASRRSSTASLQPLSRHSSLNSLHRRPHDMSPSVVQHRRRRSDASRTSTDDREQSRPPSVRSISGSDVNAHRRAHHRHSQAGSSSSLGSLAYPSSVSPKEALSYRRPPTTTTVRRRHGSNSQSRHSHGRQRSTSSSVNTRNSSSSSAGEEEHFVDEPAGKGPKPIMEEDEDELPKTPEVGDTQQQVERERGRALRALSGDWSAAAVAAPPHKSASQTSLASSHPERPHTPVHFTAHKSHHLFGAPSQPSHLRRRAFIRDVFATRDDDGEWVDEGEDLDCYGGGLGQDVQTAGKRDEAPVASVPALNSPVPLLAAAGNSVGLFESRYAGVPGASQTGGARRLHFKGSALIVEEEEEEEEG